MPEASFLDPYKALLVSDDVISKADELDLVILPLYSRSDAKYYYNVIDGFCRMQEYTHFWKTMKILRNQVFVLSKKCNPHRENTPFPKNSLIFPASLLDPIRSCMSPRFPDVRFANPDGTKSYIIRLADLTTWGNATHECSGTSFVKNGVDTAPVPVPEIIDGTRAHWRAGDYLPEYMADATFFLDEVRFSVTDKRARKGEDYNISDTDFSVSADKGIHYHIVLTVNKLQPKDSMLKERYGVACIGSFCLESSRMIEPNRIAKVDDGTYMVTLSSTAHSGLDCLQILLTTNSIKLLRLSPIPSKQSDQPDVDEEVLDSVELSGSLYHAAIVAGPNDPNSMLPSKQVDLKIALRSSESIRPLPVKDFMIQDSMATFQDSDPIETLKYGYNHFLTPAYGAQLLRLPAECFSGTGLCATPHHIRLAMHMVILIVIFLMSFIVMPAYIIGKWILIRRLKAAAQKQEASTGIALYHKIIKTPKNALKRVVRESQRMYANHLDQKRVSLKSAMSGKETLSLKDVAAILDVFPLDN